VREEPPGDCEPDAARAARHHATLSAVVIGVPPLSLSPSGPTRLPAHAAGSDVGAIRAPDRL
jgi:hypothetical protein